jgi:SAM-dependent methyltransferase
VADRVEVRCVDARDLDDEASFTACFWAQAFFPADARAATLAAILRALRPDGLLLVQEVLPPQPATVRAQLDQLFFRQLDAAVGVSAEALAAEADAAGFRDARIIESPLGRLVLAHTPPAPAGR